MKILKKGRNLKEDEYIGSCNTCDCKFECGNSEVSLFGGRHYSHCPNCKSITWMERIIPISDNEAYADS